MVHSKKKKWNTNFDSIKEYPEEYSIYMNKRLSHSKMTKTPLK